MKSLFKAVPTQKDGLGVNSGLNLLCWNSLEKGFHFLLSFCSLLFFLLGLCSLLLQLLKLRIAATLDLFFHIGNKLLRLCSLFVFHSKCLVLQHLLFFFFSFLAFALSSSSFLS